MNDIKKINAGLQALMRGSFYVLIFFLPISIAMVESFSGFVILFFLARRALACAGACLPPACRQAGTMQAGPRSLAPFPGFLNGPLALLTVAVVLACVFSEYPATSWVSFFAKFLQGYFLYAGFLEAFDRQEQVNNFVWIWFGSAFVTGVNGLCQFWAGIDFLRLTPLTGGRISSSLR